MQQQPVSCVARRTRNRLAQVRGNGSETTRRKTPGTSNHHGGTGRGSGSAPILGFVEEEKRRRTGRDPVVIVLDDDDDDDDDGDEEGGGGERIGGNGGDGSGVSSGSASDSSEEERKKKCSADSPQSSSSSDGKAVEIQHAPEPACCDDPMERCNEASGEVSAPVEERLMPSDSSDNTSVSTEGAEEGDLAESLAVSLVSVGGEGDSEGSKPVVVKTPDNTSVSTKGAEEGDLAESPAVSLVSVGGEGDSEGSEPVVVRTPDSYLGCREEEPSSLGPVVSGNQMRVIDGRMQNGVASRTRLGLFRGMLRPVDYSVYFKKVVNSDEESESVVASSSSSCGSDSDMMDDDETWTINSNKAERGGAEGYKEGEIGLSFKERRFSGSLASSGEDEGDTWRTWSYFSLKCKKKMQKSKKRKRAQAPGDDELFKMFINTIQKKSGTIEEMLLSPEDDPVEGAHTTTKDDEQLPLIFSFAVEDPVLVEKSEFEKAVDELWVDYDFIISSNEIGSHDKCEDEGNDVQEIEARHSTLCSPGKHHYILDEQIGILCKFCCDVLLEIKYVLPSWGGYSEGMPSRNFLGNQGNNLMLDQLLTNEKHDRLGASNNLSEGTVWDVIPGIKQTLYPHQQEGFEFMWRNLAGDIFMDKLKSAGSSGLGGCVISHAPGTGKSRLTIVFLQTFMKVFPECRPVIVAPRGMLLTWEKEFKKWKVDSPIHILNGEELSGREDLAALKLVQNKPKYKRWIRLVKLYSWNRGNSILGISYGLFGKLVGKGLKKHDTESADIGKILLERPDLFVFDEGHTARNEQSLIWKVLEKIKTERRIILSGTPFQNNFVELYNTLCLVRPKFADKISYRASNFSPRKQSLADKKGRHLLAMNEGRGKWASLTSSITNDSLDQLRAMIKPFVHVHHGSSLKSLPGLRDCLVVLNPLSCQKGILENFEYLRSDSNFRIEYIISLASVHPSLLLFRKLTEKEESFVDRQILEKLRLNPNEGVKTRFIMELVRLCEVFNERIVIFSQYIDPLSLIRDQLVSLFGWTEGVELLIMNGKIPSKFRQLSIDHFNDARSKARVLLASTKACCEGISLTGASRVVLLDVVWNPSVERQAISRAYRLGQQKIVYTYHLITSGTRDGDKYYKQAEKDRLSKLVFSSGDRNHNTQDSSLNASTDRILKEMVEHDKLKDMFKQILHQPKESKLIDAIKF